MRKLTFVLVALLLVAMVPSAAFAQGGYNVTYTAGFNLQNLGSATANVVVDFYDTSGNVAATISDTIPVGANKTYYPMAGVPQGFNGSAVVSSDQQIAAITNVLGNNAQRGDAYPGFSAGATSSFLPLVMKNNYGINTWFNVQNTSATPASVTVTYSPGTCTESFTIPAYAAHTFDQTTNACLGTSFIGAAKITSAQPIVAVVMQVNASSLLAYAGFPSTAQTLVAPSVQSNYYKSGTSINVMNTGASSTNVTVSYMPSAGFPGAACQETLPVAAGQSRIFGFPQLPAGCGTQGAGVTDTVNGGFVGSAKVTNDGGQPLVAIVNQITRGAANGSAYDAIDPAAGTAHVSMPLIMDRNFGIFTGFSITNVGAQATSINCVFSGNSNGYTVTANLQPGQTTTAAQLNQIANGYLGAGTCTATGGDQKIAGIVNERIQNAPATTDSVYSYNAFNY